MKHTYHILKKRFFLFALTFLCSTAYSQWPSFTLKSTGYSDFKEQTSPYFAMISSQVSTHPVVLRSIDSRFRAGVNISGHSPYSDLNEIGLRPGILPTLSGAVIVTSNLAFHGMVSGLPHATGLTSVQGWGLRLFLTDDPKNDWSISTKFSRLDNPNKYRLSTIDFVVEKEWQLSSLHLRAGLGSNTYKSRIFIDGDDIPSSVRGSAVYVTFGMIFNYQRFLLYPEFYVSQTGIQLGLGLQKGFH